MNGELTDSEVIAAFRSEVGAWAPTRVPNLLDLTRKTAHHWRRPIAFTSAMASLTLAVVLVLSLLVVIVIPESIPGMEYVKLHLVTGTGP